jgi:hypothetical protein
MEYGLASLSTGDLVRFMEAVAAELALRTPPESGTAALEWAEALGRSIDLAEAGLAVLVARVDTCGAHQQWGFPSAVAWLRGRLGMRHGRAAERVTLARQLPRLERPAHLCEIHHLDGGWKLGTRTDIDKLVPACGWHNRWFEQNTDRITQTRDTQGRTVLTIQQPRINDTTNTTANSTTTPGDTEVRQQPQGP